jgi:hypothetical protein
MVIEKGLQQLNEYPSHMGGDTCIYGGYVWEYFPSSRHLSNKWGWCAQHRLVAESMLGRQLIQSVDESVSEVVHHIDNDRVNNHPCNLQVMTKKAHRQLHAREAADKVMSRLTEEMVQSELDAGCTIRQAADNLGVHHQTIRNRFPRLVAHLKRRSPVDVHDPKWPDILRQYAADKSWTLRATANELGISMLPIRKICQMHGIDWVANKSDGRTGRPKGSKNKMTSLQA